MKRNNKIWEKQKWETSKSFGYFQRYFLFQKRRPRSLNEAYRLFQIEKNSRTREEAKKMSPSSSWQNWYNGKYPSGLKIPNSKTWLERAKAYDDFLLNAKTNQDKEKRDNLLESELNDVSMQIEVWQILFDALRVDVIDKKTKGELTSLTRSIRELNDLSKLRDTLAVFQRRALKMPASIKDAPENEEDESSFSFEFEEPFGPNDEIGAGSEQINKDKKQNSLEETSHGGTESNILTSSKISDRGLWTKVW